MLLVNYIINIPVAVFNKTFYVVDLLYLLNIQVVNSILQKFSWPTKEAPMGLHLSKETKAFFGRANGEARKSHGFMSSASRQKMKWSGFTFFWLGFGFNAS
jgi:hypothetical protein